MDITIKNQILTVTGALNADTSSVLKETIDSFFKNNQKIILDISKIEKIDLAGFNTLVHIKMVSKELDKSIQLLGKKNELIKHFLDYSKLDFLFD